MKIAVFTNTYWPTVNGVAVSVKNLREGLLKLGHKVYVFAPDVEELGKVKDQENVYRYPSFAIKKIANYEVALPFAPRIKEILEKEKFDIVHTEHPLWIGKWGLNYAKSTNTPIITTVHTQYDLYAKLIPLPQGIIVPILKNHLNKYLNSVDLITTPGESSRKRLIKQGIKTPVEVVSNPTDLSRYWKVSGTKLCQKLNAKDTKPLIGFVGRLSKEKSISVLLDAMAFVLKKIPESRLVLIGDGPDKKELQKQAEGINGERITFLGNIKHEEIPAYYAAFDLFMSASVSEVQPMTFAEAMATGTALVVFDVAGCNDMVEDKENGLLVAESKGAQGLAEAAVKLLSDKKELEATKKRAQKWATRYDLINATQDMLKAYEKTIHLHKNKP